jgi:hypothetical protein
MENKKKIASDGYMFITQKKEEGRMSISKKLNFNSDNEESDHGFDQYRNDYE